MSGEGIDCKEFKQRQTFGRGQMLNLHSFISAPLFSLTERIPTHIGQELLQISKPPDCQHRLLFQSMLSDMRQSRYTAETSDDDHACMSKERHS